MKKFPAIEWMARHGRRFSLIAAVVVLLAGLATAAIAASPLLATGVVIVAAVVWAVLRVVSELLEVIAETLLPR